MNLRRRIDRLEDGAAGQPTYDQLLAVASELPPGWMAWIQALPDEAVQQIIDGDDLPAIFAKHGAPRDELRQSIDGGVK